MGAETSNEWQRAIDRIRDDYTSFSERLAKVEYKADECERRHDGADKRHEHLCETLNKTKESIEQSIDDVRKENKGQTDIIIGKIDLLMSERYMRKGAESALKGMAKHLPTIIWCLVSAAFACGIFWATMGKP